VSDLDTTILAIPHGHGYRLMTRYTACAMYALAEMSGSVREAQFWQAAMAMDAVA